MSFSVISYKEACPLTIRIDDAELIAMARRLISIPTENPPGEYEVIAGVLSELMQDSGLEVQALKGRPDKPNVVGLWRGTVGGSTLMLSGHTDVVSAGDRLLWSYPPYEGCVADGYIWGRGSVDMKGALAAHLSAVRALRRSGFVPRENVMLAATVDDEIAGKMGMKYLLEEGLLDAGLPIPTFHVLGEATGLQLMTVFKGRVWVRIRVAGKAAHGGSPSEGINAIQKMMDLARDIISLPSGRHELVGPDTCNLGVIQGGSSVNVVPDECEAMFDIRMGPPLTAGHYVDRLNGVLEERKACDPKLQVVDVDIFERRDPVESPGECPGLTLLEDVIQEVTGSRPHRLGTLSAGDQYYSLKAGIPGAWFGPGDPSLLHKTDERIEIAQLFDSASVYARFIERFCG